MGFIRDAWHLPKQHKLYGELSESIQNEDNPESVRAMRAMTRLWLGAGAALGAASVGLVELNTDYETFPDGSLSRTLLVEYLQSEKGHIGLMAVGAAAVAIRSFSALHQEATQRLAQLENYSN